MTEVTEEPDTPELPEAILPTDDPAKRVPIAARIDPEDAAQLVAYHEDLARIVKERAPMVLPPSLADAIRDVIKRGLAALEKEREDACRTEMERQHSRQKKPQPRKPTRKRSRKSPGS